MKKIIALSLVLLTFTVTALTAEESIEDASSEDFDFLFDDATDLETTDETEQEVTDVVSTYPITFSGHLDTDIGYGLIVSSAGISHTGYLNLANHFYVSSRPVSPIKIFADIYTSLTNTSPSLELYQMYMDYNLWDRMFISVGKKNISWGNCRLFDSNTVLGNTQGNTITGTVSIPFGSTNLTFAGLMKGTIPSSASGFIDTNINTNVNLKDVSYAGLFDFVVFDTLISLSAHQYHPEATDFSTIAGLELKRTIFGFDAYMHGNIDFKIEKSMNLQSFDKLNVIAGFYRKWSAPNMGINIEYRHGYDFTENKNTCEIGEQWGWNGLFNNKIALVLAGYHDLTNKKGYITPGFVLKNTFPHANLNTGITVNYGTDINCTLGTKLSIALDY